MKYSQSIWRMLVSRESLFKMTANFTLIFFFFILFVRFIISDVLFELTLSCAVFGFIYFIIYRFFSKKYNSQILSALSYILFIKSEDSIYFFWGIIVLFLGFLGAFLFYIRVIRYRVVANLSYMPDLYFRFFQQYLPGF